MADSIARRVQADVGTDDLLKAILAVLVDERDTRSSERPDQVRTEILLANAGLGHQVIAQLLGKNPDAVRMLLARARPPKSPSKGRSSA